MMRKKQWILVEFEGTWVNRLQRPVSCYTRRRTLWACSTVTSRDWWSWLSFPASVPECFGDGEVCGVGSGRRQWFFFWVGERSMDSVRVMFHYMSRLQTDQNLCIYVLYHMFWGWSESCKGGVSHKTLSYLYYIRSLCSGGFAVCDYIHDTGFDNSTRLLLRLLGVYTDKYIGQETVNWLGWGVTRM